MRRKKTTITDTINTTLLLTLFTCCTQVSAEEIFSNQFESQITLRTTEFAIVDPHIYTLVAGIACLDITDQVNSQIQNSIDNDNDNDGFLDLNNVLQFSTDQIDYLTSIPVLARAIDAQCADPLHSEACTINTVQQDNLMTLPAESGDCLMVENGTTGNYTPAPNTTSSPCFTTQAVDTTINLVDVNVDVRAFQSASRYQSGLNADQGLNKAFITEADAENVIFPANTPVVGGKSLAAVLPGGSGNCSTSDDRDLFTDNQTVGWWFYFNTTSTIIELQ